MWSAKKGRLVGKKARFGILMLAVMAGGLTVLAPGEGWAQQRELRAMQERIEDLEDQLRSITRYLSNNEDAPRDYSPSGESAEPVDQLANMVVRLNALENQIRSLTGTIEETQHQVRQLNDRLDRMAEAPAAGSRQFAGTGDAPGGAAIAPGGVATGPDGAQSGAQDEGPAPGEPEPLPTGEPTALYNAALAKLRQDDFPAAAQGFSEFVLQFPDHELTPNAQYWMGEAYYAQQNYSEAARAFLTAYTQYPESSKASGALLKLGISLGELDQKQDACAALREFSQKYPNASPIEANRANVARQDLNCP